MEVAVMSKEQIQRLYQMLDQILHRMKALEEKVEGPKADLPEELTRKEAAAYLRVGVRMVDHYAKTGLLTKRRLGGRVTFSKTDVITLRERANPLVLRKSEKV